MKTLRLCQKINILSHSKRLFTNQFFDFHNLINCQDLKKIKSPVFIDTRSKEDFEKGHVKDAVNIPQFFTYLAESSPTGLTTLKQTFKDLLQEKGINGNEHLVFYEDYLGSLKGVSCRGYYLMKLFGYDSNKIHILEDGLDGIKKNNPEIIESGTEKLTKPKGSFEPKLNEEMHVRYNDLQQKLTSDNKPVLIDVRDLEEWKGLSSSPYGPDFTPRKGRILGAKHILWTDLMKDNRSFKPNKEIEDICKSIGIENKDKEIIVYCFKGCRSSNSLVALKKAGYKNVKNYLGSWNEWSRKLELPIDDQKI
jgi:thiosulfate/3-mercaptopyruvate sulfurtransferase